MVTPSTTTNRQAGNGVMAHRRWTLKEGRNMGNKSLKLARYSIGTGDRFAHQAKAQLQACIQALECGVEIIPVWNKSNREHTIIGSEPASVRRGRGWGRQGPGLEESPLF